MSDTAEVLKQRIDSLAHSLRLAETLNTAIRAGVPRRKVRFASAPDIRRSHGEEASGSNPHVDRRRKREMKIRLENRHGQRMLQRRSREIFEGELDTERLIAANDAAYDFDFDAQLASNELSEPQEGAREEQNNGTSS